MSWSVSVKPRTAPDIFQAIDAAEPPAHLSDAQLAQVRIAKKAAKDAIEAGAVGEGTEAYYACSLSGHVGGDKAGPGTTLTIYVNQTTPPPEEASS